MKKQIQLMIRNQFVERSICACRWCTAPAVGTLICLGATLWSMNALAEEETVAPTAVLEAAPAVIVNPQANQTIEPPRPPAVIPFRPTMNRSDYEAMKAQTRLYRPEPEPPSQEVFSVTTTPFIKLWNFDGHSSSDSLTPPDTHGALGTSHFIEVTNSHIDIYVRGVPPTLVKSLTLASFFNYTTEILFDPRVVYDSTWNRWIVTADAFPESTTKQLLYIAVSTSSDPTGTFYIFNTNVDFAGNNNLFDFPQLGIDQDAVLFTANIFADGGVGGYLGSDFFAVAKARIYNGLGWIVPVFTGLVGTLAPPIVFDNNGYTYLVAAPTSGTKLTKYAATNTSRPGLTSIVSSTITVASYSVPVDAAQPGTTVKLDTSDCRFVNASTQYGTDLWQTHTVGVGSTLQARPRFYRINTSTNALTQTGTYHASLVSTADFNASIAANTSGDCFVTWTSVNTNSGNNASVRLSGKKSADTGIAFGVNALTSPTFYSFSRWGDYSAVTVDPTDSSTAWLVNEKIDSNSVWGSRIVRFGF
jgi:hypothetical protein